MIKHPTNAEVVATVVLTVLAVTSIGIGAVGILVWVFS